MPTRIRRSLNAASLVAVISLFVMTGGAYAASERQITSIGTALGGFAGSGTEAGLLAVPFPSPLAAAPAIAPASVALTRSYQSSFGSFSGQNPQALTVDQSTGDIYAISTAAGTVSRFDSSGSPKNFTAGPDAGTNTLTGLNFESFPSLAEVAIDNSGGPSDGNIYVTQSTSGQVKVFASSGEPLGSLDGSGTPAGGFGEDCGVAVDEANGDVYIASYENRVWRYSPSGAMVTEADYSGAIATSSNPCQLAVASGSLYVHNWRESAPIGTGPLHKYATSEFATGTPPSPSSTQLDSKATAVATDPSNGDVYVDEGDRISVFGASGAMKYSFGSSADFGSSSAGVAIKVGGSAYVADPSGNQIDVFGPTLEAGSRANLFSFGSFSGQNPQALTVDQSTGDIYAISTAAGTVSRFDSSGSPKNFTAGPDAGTNTLTGLNFESFPSLAEVAIDNSGGPSDGNIYVTQSTSGQVKVFASSGEPLGSLDGSGTPAGGFGEDCGVAVDEANGDVYIASYENRVWRYSPSGAMVTEADYSGAIATSSNPCQLAVASGSLYVHNWRESAPIGTGPLHKYATSEFATGTPPSPSSTQLDSKATAVATDPSNGDVYVDEGDRISVFGASGAMKYSFGSSADFGSSSAGVAIKVGGSAYVADPSGNQIDVFGPFSAPPPLLETKPATDVKHTRATLRGHLDPNGSLPITGCEFEWGVDTSYSEAPIACGEGSSFAAAADVSAELTGLTPGVTYHYRLNVTTVSGAFDGEDQNFETIPASAVPEVTTGAGSILSSTSASLDGSVNPNAIALTDCHFEYVTDTAFQSTGFTDLSSGGSQPCAPSFDAIPADFEDHPVTATVSGLDPSIVYRFRLVAENANGANSAAANVIPGPAFTETTGSPVRTATTARLDSRLDPHGANASYHFEYGDQGPCDANPCTATTPHPAGSGNEIELVSQQLENLQPSTTYHYRLVADNGNPDGLAFGADMTLTTRPSDAPLTHGPLPGPSGSDRAWEQVNAPDTGGNPVSAAFSISDDGSRVVYDIIGGNPDSEVGSAFNQLFAERTSTGWQTSGILPPRRDAPNNTWFQAGGPGDLSQIFAMNFDATSRGNADAWRLSPGGTAQHVFGLPHDDYRFFSAVADNGSRLVMLLGGSVDPDHPVASPPNDSNLYDVTSGAPHLVSLLPDGSVPSCGVPSAGGGLGALPALGGITRAPHWVSADGSYVFFPSKANNCIGPAQLYLRDLNAAQSRLISEPPSGSPVSGPDCGAVFIRSTADAAFFLTRSRLVAEDTAPSDCQAKPDGDIYRYDLDTNTLKCVTCVVPGLDANVSFGGNAQGNAEVAVSDNGSRAYFQSTSSLLPGAGPGTYRVDVASGDLAYVASEANSGNEPENGSAINSDGSFFMFSSTAPNLNALNGPQNGGTRQDYLYNDNDRSLVCVSCPSDGSSPRGAVSSRLSFSGPGSNLTPLSNDGDIAFTTPTALVSADQNTAGPGQSAVVGSDVYEWRDGRVLLITDGLTATPDKPDSNPGPKVAAVSPSGRDIFFLDPAQLTPDAIDAFDRLYDARIGGGFDFPPQPPPCSLDACQGTPKGVPEESPPGSARFSGAGNAAASAAAASPAARCRKAQVRRRSRCVSKHHRRTKRSKHRANHDRRAAR